MEHVGIDLGAKESQVCIRSSTGEILLERRLGTRRLGWFLAKRPCSRVVVEASSQAFAVADLALAAGHEVRVIPSTLVRALGVGHRGLKNDVRDARATSAASTRIDLPSVHLPSATARQRKELCTSCDGLKKCRTQLINRVRAWSRARLGTRVRATPTGLPGKLRAQLLCEQQEVPAHLEAVLTSIETLTVQIVALEKELSELAKNDELCRRLMTVPGVGPKTAIRFVAAIDEVERFSNGASVASYLGLTPGENTTGFATKRTSVTKAGPAPVRHVLTQAALSLWRTRPDDPIVRWAEGVAERRGRAKAVVALARKLALVLYALWRDGTVYDPRHHSRP